MSICLYYVAFSKKYYYNKKKLRCAYATFSIKNIKGKVFCKLHTYRYIITHYYVTPMN